jgi:hypothetical protein
MMHRITAILEKKCFFTKIKGSPSRALALIMLSALLSVVSTPFAAAQSSDVQQSAWTPGKYRPESGGHTYSLGMPPIWKGYGGIEVQWVRPGDQAQASGLLNLGLFKNLGSPVVGLAAIGAEGYGGVRASEFDWGARANLSIPLLNLGFGADYNHIDDKISFLMQLDVPIRRGGIVGRGSLLSVRWLPGRGNTLSAGFTFPLWGSKIGKTRPRRDYVQLVRQESEGRVVINSDSTLAEVLDTLRARILGVARLTQPFAEHSGGDPQKAMQPVLAELKSYMAATDELFPGGHTLAEEIRVYHQVLDHAFSVALSKLPVARWETTPAGVTASAMAREVLLQEMLYPYNSLLGQRKKSDSFSGLSSVARSHFARLLLSEFGSGTAQTRAAYGVFQDLCDFIEESRQELRRRWEDTRFVWLPLQYGLKPEEHDSQEKLDRIIASATGTGFSRGTNVWYIINEQFQWEIARSITKAEDYHVLWIHDIRGVNDAGTPDTVSYEQVITYLQTFIDRVKSYDEVGKIPKYMIFLDQHYFELNKSRIWLRVLREPLDYTLSLPDEQKHWEHRIEELQSQLREAIDASLLLKIERSQYGESWLKNRIKVHINITNPADQSFVSHHVVGILAVPDNNMRDHRKIAFYDITEEDPYKGMAMFTGMGLGEHYVGTNWEDRALMMQGPAALAVKDAARTLAINQGFEPHQIPEVLRPKIRPAGYDQMVADTLAQLPDWFDDEKRVMQLHNQTGFRDKPINPAKAVLYSLMPDSSYIQVPDALWQNYLFASLLSGSSLRGCRSLIIAPTAESAPSSAAPTMARAHGLLSRVMVFNDVMASEIKAAGGLIKVGLYAPRQGVGDIAGRMRQAVGQTPPWLSRVYPDNRAFDDVARNAQAQLDSMGYTERYWKADSAKVNPKLHLKANFFASRTAWDALLGREEWADILHEYIAYLAQQNMASAGEGDHPDARAIPDALREKFLRLMRNYWEALSPDERSRVSYYFTLGSVNMDYRSMCLDGESMIIVSGWHSLVGILDFMLLAGLCEWPESTDELNALLPPPSGLTRSLSGLLRLIL